jgi:intracellular multiplication protein IcmL
MEAEELQLVTLRDDFYRDGFYKALSAFVILLVAIFLLIATSLYLFFSKPDPVVFATGSEFRTVALVALKEPYISTPDLIQWVSETLPAVFRYDFVNYSKELDANMPYFTANGWKNFLEVLKTYADGNAITASKLFVNAVPAGAPFILNQGIPAGTDAYAWWVQMPLNLSYSSVNKGNDLPLVIQALVVRVPTLNTLVGVAIDKMIVTKGGANQAIKNG